MFCPSCGVALARHMRYCNCCGSQLITNREATEIESAEKRLREEMVDLFWVTVFGLGLILGGMALIKSLHLGEWILIAYMILSSAAFTINFALSLWQIRRLARISAESKRTVQVGQFDINELNPAKTAFLESVPSVTENTTRALKPIAKEQIT